MQANIAKYDVTLQIRHVPPCFFLFLVLFASQSWMHVYTSLVYIPLSRLQVTGRTYCQAVLARTAVKIDDSDVNKSLQTSHVMRFFVTKPVSRLCCETSVAGFKIAY